MKTITSFALATIEEFHRETGYINIAQFEIFEI